MFVVFVCAKTKAKHFMYADADDSFYFLCMYCV